MKRGTIRDFAFAGALMGFLAGALSASSLAQKKPGRTSPAFTIMVALQTSSPFVGDGRMTFADFAFSATFEDVLFIYDPAGVLGFCSVKADKGKLFLTRREFNDVQEGDDRHKAWVEKEWPKEFPASLGMDPAEIIRNVPRSKDDMPLVPLVPPEEASLRFKAEFGLVDLLWFSKLGSNALSDMSLDFKVPWLRLLDGKPVTLKLPYKGDDPEEKGEWWIEFIPKKK